MSTARDEKIVNWVKQVGKSTVSEHECVPMNERNRSRFSLISEITRIMKKRRESVMP